MRLYLDEDLASALLVKLLEKAGHDVSTPVATRTLGQADAVQLTCAIRENRACLSRNYQDFEELHLLIAEAQGRHFGILVVRKENDPTRDLTPKLGTGALSFALVFSSLGAVMLEKAIGTSACHLMLA
jgi:predicted nuclease of predicted toxin-antitoxin system